MHKQENLSTIIQPIGIFKDLKASKIGACLKGSGTKAVTTIADGRIIPEDILEKLLAIRIFDKLEVWIAKAQIASMCKPAGPMLFANKEYCHGLTF